MTSLARRLGPYAAVASARLGAGSRPPADSLPSGRASRAVWTLVGLAVGAVVGLFFAENSASTLMAIGAFGLFGSWAPTARRQLLVRRRVSAIGRSVPLASRLVAMHLRIGLPVSQAADATARIIGGPLGDELLSGRPDGAGVLESSVDWLMLAGRTCHPSAARLYRVLAAAEHDPPSAITTLAALAEHAQAAVERDLVRRAWICRTTAIVVVASVGRVVT